MHDASYREIPLRRHDGSVRDVAVVDEADYAALSQYRWHRNNCGYATRHKAILMHREILGLVKGDGLEADHINRDRLDNRRSNLRVVTHAENTRNGSAHQHSTSRYRGVYWAKDKQRWRAQTRIDGRYYYLGHFKDEDTAGAVVTAWWAERGVEV